MRTVNGKRAKRSEARLIIEIAIVKNGDSARWLAMLSWLVDRRD
jgi:hypothetical protein